MTEEDEAFNEIERRSKAKQEAVRAAMRTVEDDDIQEYKRTWVGLTIEEIAACCRESTTTQLSFYNAIEAKLKEKNT